jgi:glucose/arabinose dehydrogenase
MRMFSTAALVLTAAVLSGCGEEATLPVSAGTGPNPTLPAPNKTLIPTVNIAPAKGWPDGALPTTAPGLTVSSFADNLDHPRWIHVLPNGDVLVAETNAPAKPGQPRPAPTASLCCAIPTATAGSMSARCSSKGCTLPSARR